MVDYEASKSRTTFVLWLLASLGAGALSVYFGGDRPRSLILGACAASSVVMLRGTAALERARARKPELGWFLGESLRRLVILGYFAASAVIILLVQTVAELVLGHVSAV